MEKTLIDSSEAKNTGVVDKRTYTIMIHSDDDFEDEGDRNNSVIIKKMKHPHKINRKLKVLNGISNHTRPVKKGTLKTRQCPSQLVKTLKVLSSDQKQWLSDVGFKSLLNFDIESIPSRLAYWVVDRFNHVDCSFKIGRHEFKITRKNVQDILGFPIGEKSIQSIKKVRRIGGKSIHGIWRAQFEGPVKGRKRIYVSSVTNIISKSEKVDMLFKLNILLVIMTVLAEGISCFTVNLKILPFISNEDVVKRIDWCGYVLECLKRSKENWNKNDRNSWYTGPLLFLVLWYVHNTRSTTNEGNVKIPAILEWTSASLKEREADELAAGGFGLRKFIVEPENNITGVNSGCRYEYDAQAEMDTSSEKDATCEKDAQAEKDATCETDAHSGKDATCETDDHSKMDVQSIKDATCGKDAQTDKDAQSDKDAKDAQSGKDTQSTKDATCEKDAQTDKEACRENDYTEEEYDSEIKSMLKYLCNTKVQLEEKMVKAVNKYPTSERISGTITLVRSEIARLLETNLPNHENYVPHINDLDEVNNFTHELQTPTMTQVLCDTDSWDAIESLALQTVSLTKSSGMLVGQKEADGIMNMHVKMIQSDSTRFKITPPSYNFKRKLSLKGYSQVKAKKPFLSDSQMSRLGNMEGKEGVDKPQSLTRTSVMHTAIGEVSVVRSLEKEMVDVVGKPQKDTPKKRVNRKIKPAAAKRSPYYNRVVKMRPCLTSIEYQVTNCFFKSMDPEYDIVFQHSSGVQAVRVMFESMIPESNLHVGVINAWACILNYEQQFKAVGSLDRIFCDTGILSDGMMGTAMRYENKLATFTRNIDNVMRNTQVQLCDADLVFIPIIQQSHFYLICFNLNTESVYLIDNIAAGDDSLNRYNRIPDLVKKLFVDCLDIKTIAKVKKLRVSNVMRLQMPWRTTKNSVDCGIFLMRHMETFPGNGLVGWGAEFSKEGDTQKAQLDRLRHKYMAKILLSDANDLKWKVEQEVDEFNRLPLDEKIKIGEDAFERIEARLGR